MKEKVYRRNINPSIHQLRAAAKDLISSGASKHGVPGDKLHRDRGREEGRTRASKARQAKIHIVPLQLSSPPPPPFLPRVAASEILSAVCVVRFI